MTDRVKFPSIPIVPAPLGARVVEGGVHFTIFSRHASRVWLMLFDDPDAETPSREFELDPATHRLGDMWHLFVPDARPGQYYLYRMAGHGRRTDARHFNPRQWLLDPYAPAVAGAPRWGSDWGLPAGSMPIHGAKFPKGIIVHDPFDWSGDVTPSIPLEETVIYEAHLRGFTAHLSSGVSAPGTYRGFIEKIPHLVELGITSVELLPVHEFNEMEYHLADDARKHLRNYWGYSTVAFFAPNARYAASGVHGQQVHEFKELVKALHQAGLEIILDVVYNHTAENGMHGPTYSFRGIDDSIYYMLEKDGKTHRNYSGCGNTVNCNHPVVRGLIIDSLRHWVTEYRIDGFRFDLASVLTRGQDGAILDHPPLVEEISEDPILRHAKLIAEAWDAAGAYQVGSFPSRHCSEWNGRYRDDVRKFWKGDGHMLGTFAGRLAGSADLYDRDQQGPLKSVNFVTCHDGFTLHDLVSYTTKRNQANMEDNRDGENHNNSFNCGVEGPTDDPAVLGMRKRFIKNFIATLMLSQGVPMLLAGDEFAQSQQGSNNAYCQDNELAWLDWSGLGPNRDLYEFARKAIALRKTQPGLRRNKFFHGKKDDTGSSDILWVGPAGGPPDWNHGRIFGCLIHGGRKYTGCSRAGDNLFLIFNGSPEPIDFQVPGNAAVAWSLVLSTEDPPPAWSNAVRVLRADAHSVAVLASPSVHG